MQSLVLISLFLIPLATFLWLIFDHEAGLFRASLVAIVSNAITLAVSLYLTWMSVHNKQYLDIEVQWFSIVGAGDIGKLSLLFDNQACIMLLVVNVVSLLVIFYSIEYKRKDRHPHRYFAYIVLFVWAMTGVVAFTHLLAQFVFWELVGFCSYLLIGFWFDKEKAVQANKKAFLINRVADLGFLAAMLILYQGAGTLQASNLAQSELISHHALYWAGLALVVGCMGKSAQFPFQVWLPDAMEGPTPVSALIHAATMVAAGVYVLVRYSFLLLPEVLDILTCVGLMTSLLGAYFALTQYDIKRVLAFSTISQLGLMVCAIGLGAPEAAYYHMITHAFFKACLFLSAGSVIHGFYHIYKSLEKHNPTLYFDKQDMRNMGGVYKFMPVTTAAFAVSALSLAGLPYVSTGFMSKEIILNEAYILSGENRWYILAFYALLLVSSMSAFYMARVLFMVFTGRLRIVKLLANREVSLHDSSLYMLIPLVVLALLSIYLFLPVDLHYISINSLAGPNLYEEVTLSIGIISSLAFGGGIFFAYNLFDPSILKKPQARIMGSALKKWLYRWSYWQLFMDDFYKQYAVQPILRLSAYISWVEKSILDRFVLLFGVLHVVLAHVFYWLERYTIDGTVKGISGAVQLSGRFSRSMVSGNWKLQLVASLIFTLLIIAGFVLLQ